MDNTPQDGKQEDRDKVVELPSVTATTPRRDDHKHSLERRYLTALLIVAIGTTAVSLAIVAYNGIYGSPDAQRLSYGILGTFLGLVWGNVAKLVEK